MQYAICEISTCTSVKKVTWNQISGWEKQINPATNFAESNALASFAARTGLLAAFPEPLYEVAQVGWVLPWISHWKMQEIFRRDDESVEAVTLLINLQISF